MTDLLPDVRKAAAYGRISEDDLKRGEGVDHQLTVGEAHIQRRGWDLAGLFRDDDTSAWSGKDRPGYKALVAEIVAGRVDTVVVRHLDRLWRDDEEAARGRKLFGKHRVLVAEYGGMEYPMWTAQGQHMARTMSGNAAYESDIKSERVRESTERRVLEGRMNGPCPYGWRREYERAPSGRVLRSWEVEHPEEAAVVREITDRLLAGDSLLSITRDLNDRGVRSPGAAFVFAKKKRAIDNPDGSRWSKTSVKKLALRESNAGLRVVRKGQPDERTVKGDWPALVAEADWRRVVALLTAEDRKIARPANRQHLLTWGIGACGVCGGHLRMAHRTAKRVPYYICAIGNGCVGRRQDYVDTLVNETMITWLSRADALEWLVPVVDAEALAEATSRAAEAKAMLEMAGGKLLSREWTVATVDSINAKYGPELDAANTEIRRLTAASDAYDEDDVTEVAGPYAREKWEALSVPRRRRYLEKFRVRVTILRTGGRGPGFDPDSVRVDRLDGLPFPPVGEHLRNDSSGR